MLCKQLCSIYIMWYLYCVLSNTFVMMWKTRWWDKVQQSRCCEVLEEHLGKAMFAYVCVYICAQICVLSYVSYVLSSYIIRYIPRWEKRERKMKLRPIACLCDCWLCVCVCVFVYSVCLLPGKKRSGAPLHVYISVWLYVVCVCAYRFLYACMHLSSRWSTEADEAVPHCMFI